MYVFDKERSCCFSGHRPQKLPDKGNELFPAMRNLKSCLLQAIEDAAENGYHTFLCGMAMGFDIIAGEAVLLAKKKYPDIELVCAVPFENQASAFPLSWQARYRNLLRLCDYSTTLSEQYHSGCFAVRNRFMVEHSCYLICYCDESSYSGSSQTLRFAQKAGSCIVNLKAIL